VDIGFLLEIERPKVRSEGYELRWGPLLQTEFGTQVQAHPAGAGRVRVLGAGAESC